MTKKTQYSVVEQARRSREFNIEEADLQYTKAGLVAELRRRRHHVTARGVSRVLSYYINDGLVEPPHREQDKRGRPGLYNGSVVIVMDLVKYLRQNQVFVYRSSLKQELPRLKLLAAGSTGHSVPPVSLPAAVDSIYADLIRREAPMIYERLRQLEDKRHAYSDASRALKSLAESLMRLRDIDEGLAKRLLLDDLESVRKVHDMTEIPDNKK